MANNDINDIVSLLKKCLEYYLPAAKMKSLVVKIIPFDILFRNSNFNYEVLLSKPAGPQNRSYRVCLQNDDSHLCEGEINDKPDMFAPNISALNNSKATDLWSLGKKMKNYKYNKNIIIQYGHWKNGKLQSLI